jgi:hypothetical protein
MDKVLIRMIADPAPVPEVIFVGSQDKAEAMLFRVMYNAEGGYGRVENEHGIHITVNETRTEVQGKKSVPVIKEVHYFLQNAKGNY